MKRVRAQGRGWVAELAFPNGTVLRYHVEWTSQVGADQFGRRVVDELEQGCHSLAEAEARLKARPGWNVAPSITAPREMADGA